MANQVIRLSSLEFDQILDDLINYIKAKYPDQWSDFLHSNLGMVFLEAVSAVADNLAFYINQLANELFLPTAVQRRAVVNLAKLVGYEPKRAIPAKGLLRFYVDKPLNFNVIIPKGTVCEAQNGIKVETTEEGVIPAGQSEALVSAIQRESGEILYRATEDGFTEIFIGDKGAYEFEVRVNEQLINEVPFIVDAYGDRAYKVEEKEDGYLVVLFLNAGDEVRIRYFTTKGKEGNLGSGAVNRVLTPVKDSTGNVVGVRVDNLPFTGGEDRESIESIKKNAFLFTRTQDRAVSEEDYTNMALLVDGVYKAKAKLVDWGCSANIVYVYVCSLDASGNPIQASSAIKNNVVAELTKKGILTVTVYAQDVNFQNVNISGNLKVKAGFDPSDVIAKVNGRIKELFGKLNIGEALRYSDLYRVVDETEGVEYVEITSPSGSVFPANDVTLLTFGGANWNVV